MTTNVPHASTFAKVAECVPQEGDERYDIECQRALNQISEAACEGLRYVRFVPQEGHQFGEVLKYMERRFTPELGYRVSFVEEGRRMSGSSYNSQPLYTATGSIRISF